ncbi:zinc ribbon domain-containing protein YjdM [Marinomonas sp. TW1]|uniref:zinc ribbon domain-containing protein YjdM n=1 Tax=Marinomonas sp. TW1 TaxID=1561203 RepID=UPI0007AF86A5|nr:zinc ribbon domain-containing protein YjdM [Marinomonas sp. TW1]KZN13261.1 alkylphosphonate utilization protein [Marinomonas sp. TW1]
MPLPPCSNCHSDYVYQDQSLLICPECGYEWGVEEEQEDEVKVLDANGNLLVEGGKVTLIKDLKVKGSSQVLKMGTKAVIKRIKEGKDHQLDCRVYGVGDMFISAHFVKKS